MRETQYCWDHINSIYENSKKKSSGSSNGERIYNSFELFNQSQKYHYTPKRRNTPTPVPRKYNGNSYSSWKSDSYDVSNYDDPDDFADDWADEFGDGDYDGGYGDAYDYWERKRKLGKRRDCMKMKIRKNTLKIVATGIATGLAFSVSCWSVAASDSTDEAKAEETQEYDALQKIFLEINKETTEDKLLKLIEEHSVEYTAEEYNGTPKSRNYNIAFDSDVVLQKYAESGDSLEACTFLIRKMAQFYMQSILMKHRSEYALYYNYGTYWDFREDELDNTYTGYYYYKPGDTKGGITMKYDNGNSKETGYHSVSRGEEALTLN